MPGSSWIQGNLSTPVANKMINPRATSVITLPTNHMIIMISDVLSFTDGYSVDRFGKLLSFLKSLFEGRPQARERVRICVVINIFLSLDLLQKANGKLIL